MSNTCVLSSKMLEKHYPTIHSSRISSQETGRAGSHQILINAIILKMLSDSPALGLWRQDNCQIIAFHIRKHNFLLLPCQKILFAANQDSMFRFSLFLLCICFRISQFCQNCFSLERLYSFFGTAGKHTQYKK